MCSHSETLTTRVTVKHSTTINRSLTEVKAVCYEILLDKLSFFFHFVQCCSFAWPLSLLVQRYHRLMGHTQASSILLNAKPEPRWKASPKLTRTLYLKLKYTVQLSLNGSWLLTWLQCGDSVLKQETPQPSWWREGGHESRSSVCRDTSAFWEKLRKCKKEFD